MFRIYGDEKNKTNFPAAKEEHKITIILKDESVMRRTLTPTNGNYGTIVGYLSKEFEYSSKGNYTNIFGATGSDSLLLKVAEDTIQKSVLPVDYGFLTKKMFTHGESPTVSVEFRCWSGESSYTGSTIEKDKTTKKDVRVNSSQINNPVAVANALINATLPRISSKSPLLNPTVDNVIPAVVNSLGSIVGDLAILAFNVTPVTMVAKGVFTDRSNKEDIKKGVDNLGNDISDWMSKKPPVCEVTIGNIFSKDFMVVMSVDVKFSKEYSDKGVPLYADFNVTFQSLFSGSVIDKYDSTSNKEKVFGSGLNNNVSSRVTFDDMEISSQDVENWLAKTVTPEKLKQEISDKFNL